MKILLTTMPFQGHVAPTLPVASRLSQRGHEVRWYTGADYKHDVRSTGAEWLPMGAIPSREPARLDECLKRFEDIMPAQKAELSAYLDQDMADVILSDPTVLASPELWIEGGPVYVMLSMLPLLFAPPEVPLILQGTIAGFEYPRPGNTNIACIGPLLPPPPDPRTIFPDQLEALGMPNSCSFSSVPWWHEIDTTKPIVHVSQGTIATDPTNLIIPTLEACADLPVTVIAQAPRDSVPEDAIPKNARVVEWCSHAWLFSRMAVFITNGGYSGVQRALAAGVPLIVGGYTEDKPAIAERVAWAGNGINLGTGKPIAKMISAALNALAHTPRYQERAWELAARCRETNPPMTAAMLLEHYLPHWREHPPLPSRPVDETQQAVA